MKQMVSKSLVALMCLLLGLSLSSCNRQSQSTVTANGHKQIVIGISIPAGDHGWTAGVNWWAEKAMALHPEIKWNIQQAKTGQEQINQIENMMATGIDGLVVLPQDPVDAVTKAAQEAHDRGIFIVNVDRALTAPIADVHLEGDNVAFGRKSGEFIVDHMHDTGNLVILTGIPCQVDTDRVNAAMAVFKQHPNIHIVAQQEADWNREKGFEKMQGILATNPHIDAVWAQDDDTLMGAVKAIKAVGRQKEMWILGGAGMKDVIKMVMDHDPMVPADITYPPSMIAAGIEIAASVLRDGNQAQIKQFMPRHLIQDVDLVTPENAKDYYFPDSIY